MVSIHSDQEMDLINKVTSKSDNPIWTGLIHMSKGITMVKIYISEFEVSQRIPKYFNYHLNQTFRLWLE